MLTPSLTWKDSCLLLYYRWRLILFLEAPLGRPLLATWTPQFKCRPHISQLRDMLSDRCYRCHPSRHPRNLTQFEHTCPRVQVIPMSTLPLGVSQSHRIMQVTRRLARFLLELEVAIIRRPPYPATTSALPNPCIIPESLARTTGAVSMDITPRRRPLQTSEKPAQALCFQTLHHFLSTHLSP
jgi:hypothetical protein